MIDHYANRRYSLENKSFAEFAFYYTEIKVTKLRSQKSTVDGLLPEDAVTDAQLAADQDNENNVGNSNLTDVSASEE